MTPSADNRDLEVSFVITFISKNKRNKLGDHFFEGSLATRRKRRGVNLPEIKHINGLAGIVVRHLKNAISSNLQGRYPNTVDFFIYVRLSEPLSHAV